MIKGVGKNPSNKKTSTEPPQGSPALCPLLFGGPGSHRSPCRGLGAEADPGQVYPVVHTVPACI